MKLRRCLLILLAIVILAFFVSQMADAPPRLTAVLGLVVALWLGWSQLTHSSTWLWALGAVILVLCGALMSPAWRNDGLALDLLNILGVAAALLYFVHLPANWRFGGFMLSNPLG